jgi:transcriptional regulator of NAD metabolism
VIIKINILIFGGKMNSKYRRYEIERILLDSKNPIKGHELASNYQVTRQVIVKDIAILRAEGKEIIATPEGYIITSDKNNKKERIIAISHGNEDIEKELKIIVKFGGIIKDVIVEHPVYGEIKANLMIKSYFDVENFIDNLENEKAKPLLSLTKGVHLHTIAAEKEEILVKIVNELDKAGYLIK